MTTKTNKPTHTPGPWTVKERVDGHMVIKAADGTSNVAVLGLKNDGAEADALLIVAAPDLLEAARAMVNVKSGFTADEAMQLLDAAIAKAEGR